MPSAELGLGLNPKAGLAEDFGTSFKPELK